MGQESKAKAARGHSLTTLTKICPLLTPTYLHSVDIGEGNPLLSGGEICIPLSFPVPPTYLPRLVNVVKERTTKESKDFA